MPPQSTISLSTVRRVLLLSSRYMKQLKARSFRAWQENRDRLEFAEKLGFNVSELINEVLREHLQTHMQAKVEKLRKALSVPAK